MERESFEDEEVGSILNEHFISIKVDREERPDIDGIYMEVCQALTGSGGWPLTVLMTPDQKPFFAGTYFPINNMGQHVGLMHILNVTSTKWQTHKTELLESAEQITTVIKESVEENNHSQLDEHILEKTFNTFEMKFDKEYGGFGTQPKFPAPHNLLFLLRYGLLHKNNKAIEMVEATLTQMYKGGIFDHVGYGFSRYSVDNKWLVPHFEKMLYDNALLCIVFIEAYQATNNPLFKEVAEKILEYVRRDMTSPEGGFYTAEDADSEGVEGKFYIWSLDEIDQVLNKEDADFISQYYNITTDGNFENANILNLIHHDKISIDSERIKTIRNQLFKHRGKRVHPYKDDKILTSWNAMMIVAFALAGKVFHQPNYIAQAEQSMEFISKHLIVDGRIMARFRDGQTKYHGYLDDYAYLTWAWTELFLATSNIRYIERAKHYTIKMIDLFSDAANGGFYTIGKDSETLIMKTKDSYDGAIPSGNSVATMNLMRLSEITDDISFVRLAFEQFHYFADKINQSPTAYTHMLTAYMMYKAPKTKTVLVLENIEDLNSFKTHLYNRYRPFTTAIILYKEESKNEIFEHYTDDHNPLALYVCENYACNEPVYDKQSIIEILKEL